MSGWNSTRACDNPAERAAPQSIQEETTTRQTPRCYEATEKSLTEEEQKIITEAWVIKNLYRCHDATSGVYQFSPGVGGVKLRKETHGYWTAFVTIRKDYLSETSNSIEYFIRGKLNLEEIKSLYQILSFGTKDV